jgi:hypothetical protein
MWENERCPSYYRGLSRYSAEPPGVEVPRAEDESSGRARCAGASTLPAPEGNSSLCCMVTALAQPFLFWVDNEGPGGETLSFLETPLVSEKVHSLLRPRGVREQGACSG